MTRGELLVMFDSRFGGPFWGLGNIDDGKFHIEIEA